MQNQAFHRYPLRTAVQPKPNMPTKRRHMIASACVMSAFALAGCATSPLPSWTPAHADTASDDIGTALSHLRDLRTHYRSVLTEQLGREQQTSNLLIGAGALIAGMAAAKVGSDAIAGATLLTGTGYVLANNNLRRSRVRIYLEGINALDCTERAAVPLIASKASVAALDKALIDLDASRTTLRQALTDARQVQQQSPGDAALGEFETLSTAAAKALASSATTAQAGAAQARAWRQGAALVFVTVNGIQSAVEQAVVEDTPDLSAVPKAVGSLAGVAAGFAPGAAISVPAAATQTTPAARGDTGKGGLETFALRGWRGIELQGPSALEVANAKVRTALETVSTDDRAVRSQLDAAGKAVDGDAFGSCRHIAAIAPLQPSPETLQFTAGTAARRLVTLNGGSPPYFVEWDGDLLEGLSLKPIGRYDKQLELSTDKTAKAGETRLRITDSSSTGKTAWVTVTVAGAPAANPTPRISKNPGPTKEALDRLEKSRKQLAEAAEKLKRVEFVELDGLKFTMTKPVVEKSQINTRVTCPADSAGKFTKADLQKAMLDKAGITVQTGIVIGIELETGCTPKP